MNNLKGQQVYTVTEFNRNDDAIGYQIFASVDDANEAVATINKTTRKTGNHAYWSLDTIY